jgi:hypothetical protein
MDSDVPIVCNLDALSPEQRARRVALASRVRDLVSGISETESGYRLQLPDDPEAHQQVVELVLLERRCCPFLEFALHFEPADGPTRLEVGGPPGVKAFLRTSGLLAGGDAGSCAI